MTRPASPKFTAYCRMTCIGGSEVGECPCTNPASCEMQDDAGYPIARDRAKERMGRYLMSKLPANVVDALNKPPRGKA